MKDHFDERLANKIRAELENYRPAYSQQHWAQLSNKMGKPHRGLPFLQKSAGVLLVMCCMLIPFHLNRVFHSSGPVLAGLSNRNQSEPLVETSAAQILNPPSTQKQLAAAYESENTPPPSTSQTDNLKVETVEAPVNNKGNRELDRQKSAYSDEVATSVKEGSTAPINTEENGEVTALGQAVIDLAGGDQHISGLPIAENGKRADGGIASTEGFVRDAGLLAELEQFGPKLLATDQLRTKGNEPVVRPQSTAMVRPKSWFWELQGSYMQHQNKNIDFRESGYSAGIRAVKVIDRKWQLIGGLNILRHAAKVIPDQKPFTLNSSTYDETGRANRAIFNLSSSQGMGAGEKVKVITKRGEFTSIEIPVLVKYDLSIGTKQQYYLMGGFNSLMHLEEVYQFEEEYFRALGMGNFPEVQIRERELRFGAVEHIDWLPYLQFAMGWKPYFGKTLPISVEAFSNIPITNMGSEQVSTNTLGIRFVYRLSKAN